MKKAVLFGLRKLDEDFYDGWDGDCPGTLIDVAIMRELLADTYDEVDYHDHYTANNFWFNKEIKYLAKNSKEGDTVLIYFSGHGGQAKDLNKDEKDGKDETLCLYDGEITDDQINNLLQEFEEKVDLIIITDCCHSGTNLDINKKPLKCNNVIHFAGCNDGNFSYGNILDGGTLTRTLATYYHNNNKNLTWLELFNLTKKHMEENQIPIINYKGDLINKEAF